MSSPPNQSLRCSELHTRDLTVPNCINGLPCQRTYHFYLPRVLCHGGARRRGRRRHLLNGDDFEFYTGNYEHIGTLPLVFAIHGYLTTARSMQKLLPLADDYHFVLVFPEGLEQSFNAGACCGYALENNIDDVGYLEMIQAGMAAEFFGFVNPLYTFGIGHNNGAFLLTYALERSQPLFRSIVPISGYTHHVDLVRSGLNSVHNAANGIGIMLHHSLDDSIVRPSGCCVNTKLPQCHGDIQFDPDHPEYCWSVLQMLSDWAMVVNKCDDSRLDHSTVGFKEVVGTSGEVAYALTYVGEDQYTALTFNPDFNSPQKEVDVLYKTDLALSVTYQTPFVTCVATESPSCTANSTLCLYTDNGGEHGFHGNDFDNEFFMHEEVFDFIAKEACVANGGVMTKIPGNPATGKNAKRVCACPVSFAGESNEDEFGGVYCLDSLNEDGTLKLPSLGVTGGGQVASTNPGGSKPEKEVLESTLTNADEVTPEQGMSVASQASDVQETPYSPLPDGVTPETYEPTWYKRRTGWHGATYQGAVDFCASVGKNLCPYQVYCSGGPRSPIFSGGIVESSDYEDREYSLSRDVQWAPIINTKNEWIQILEGDDSCLTYTMLAGEKPSWGSSDKGDQAITGYLMCCHTRWGITEVAGVTATPTPKPTTVEPASQLVDNSAHLGSNTQQLPNQTEQGTSSPLSEKEEEEKQQQTEEVSLSSPYSPLPDGVTPEMYEPTWYKRRTGWHGATYQGAVDFCASVGKNLCPYQVYCSGGPRSPIVSGGIVESSDYEDRDYVLSRDVQWAPIINTKNEWIQILEGDESCYTHTMLAGKQPSWGSSDKGDQTVTGYLMCCHTRWGITEMAGVTATPTPKPTTELSLSSPYSNLPDGVTPEIYEPTWYKRRTGWHGATYQGAVDFCASVGKNLCPYQVYCSGGPRSPIFSGGIVESSDYEDRDYVLSRDVQWAPIINTKNEWIQILEGDDSCLTHTMLAGKQPSWGSSTDGDQTVTGYLMCCHARMGITEEAGVTATPTPKPTTVEPASQLVDNSAHLGSNTQQLPDQTEQGTSAPSSDAEQEWEKQQTEEVSLSFPYGHLPDGVTPETYEPTWYKRRTGWQGAAYQEAVDFCVMMEQMLCPYQVYCSGGPKSIVYDGGAVESSDYEDRDYVLSKDEQWSPIANSENEWVQILEGDESCYTHTMLAGKQPSWMGTIDGAHTITGYLMCCRIPGPGTTGMSDVAANPTPKPATAEPSNQLIDNSASQASMEETSIDNSATQSSMEETQNAAGLFPLESIQQETDTSATLPSFTIETLPVESTSEPPKKETPESPGQSNENKMSSPGVTVMNKPVSPKESSQVANETNQISLASNAGDMSDTNTSKDSNIHVTWMLVLMAIFTLLGLGLIRRRRRRAEYARALAQQRARYQDALEFRRAGNPSSPYRDYFQGGDNGNGFEDDTNIDDVSDHAPHQYESETVIRHGKSPAGDLDDLGQSQWDDGYRFGGKLSDTAKKIFGSTDMKDAAKQDIMDDYSFSPSSSVDDSDAASQGSHQSKSYLNPSDLNMLQKFRQKTKSKKPDPDAAIIRRQSETEEAGSSYRVSFTRKDSKDVFDDLEDIEKDIV